MKASVLTTILIFVLVLPAVSFASNNPDWEAIYDSGNSDSSSSIARDSMDNLYVAGSTTQTGYESTATLIKYDSSGQFLWDRTFSLNTYTYFDDIAVDDLDGIYITGHVNNDSFLVKYNTAGDVLWYTMIERTYDYTYAGSLDVDASGIVHVLLMDLGVYDAYCGGFIGSGSGTLWSFLAYDGDGNRLQKVNFSSSSSRCGVQNGPHWYTLAVTPDGSDIYVGGTAYAGYTNTGTTRVAKYTSGGVQLWQSVQDMTNAYIEWILSLDIDPAGNILAGGYFQEPETYDYNGMLFKFDSTGVLLWGNVIGESNESDDQITDITTDTLGNVYATGLQGPDEHGLLTMKYDPDGMVQWNRDYWPSGYEILEGQGLVLGSDSSVYVTGILKQSTWKNQPFDVMTLKYAQ